MRKKNSTNLILLLCTVLITAFAFGCGHNRVFTWQGDVLTDGNASYRYLDSDREWCYRGKFKIRIGVKEGGNAIFASDETEWLIKEREDLLQDMYNNPLIRTDIILPDPNDEHNRLEVNHSILSEEAATQLRACANESNGQSLKLNKGELPTFVSVLHPEIDELAIGYEREFMLRGTTLYLGEYQGLYTGGTFDIYQEIPEDSALYREVLEAMK